MTIEAGAAASAASSRPSGRLLGLRALVTGASQGIGRAIALRFAQEGATVAVNARRRSPESDETLELVTSASAEGGGDAGAHAVVEADVGSEAEVVAMFNELETRWGGLDVLVNNAGILSHAPSHALEAADLRRTLDVNLVGAVLCARSALQQFLRHDVRGVILNCSSVHETIPKPEYLAYSISKGGIGCLTRTLALEYASRGIRVNAVAPGAVQTPMNRNWVDVAERRAVVESHIPLGRTAEAAEIAAVFAFLASRDASYITGQTIYACGGLTLYNDFRETWAS